MWFERKDTSDQRVGYYKNNYCNFRLPHFQSIDEINPNDEKEIDYRKQGIIFKFTRFCVIDQKHMFYIKQYNILKKIICDNAIPYQKLSSLNSIYNIPVRTTHLSKFNQ